MIIDLFEYLCETVMKVFGRVKVERLFSSDQKPAKCDCTDAFARQCKEKEN